MKLERILAEVEVLAREVSARASPQVVLKGYDYFRVFENVSKVISHDPAVIYENYLSAKRELAKKSGLSASRALTEFCLNTKNLADSLNIFLQVLYGTDKPGLKKLDKNVMHAPTASDGKGLAEVINLSHDHSASSVSNILRNMKAHAKGYSALMPASLLPSGYAIDITDNKGVKLTPVDAGEWLDNQIETYFTMTREILSSISNRDTVALTPKKDSKKGAVTLQRLKNWANKHKPGVLIGVTSALIASGIIGTLSYQALTKKDRLLYEGEEIRGAVHQAYINRNGGILGFDMERESFNATLNTISNRSQNIGTSLDKYISKLKGYSDGVLNEDIEDRYSNFVRERQTFNRLISEASKSVNARSNTIDNVQMISDLLMRERLLGEKENEIFAKIGFSRPYNYVFSK